MRVNDEAPAGSPCSISQARTLGSPPVAPSHCSHVRTHVPVPVRVRVPVHSAGSSDTVPGRLPGEANPRPSQQIRWGIPRRTESRCGLCAKTQPLGLNPPISNPHVWLLGTGPFQRATSSTARGRRRRKASSSQDSRLQSPESTVHSPETPDLLRCRCRRTRERVEYCSHSDCLPSQQTRGKHGISTDAALFHPCGRPYPRARCRWGTRESFVNMTDAPQELLACSTLPSSDVAATVAPSTSLCPHDHH